jgi:hypothetical protein
MIGAVFQAIVAGGVLLAMLIYAYGLLDTYGDGNA